jgi:hypothetical protein
VGAPSLLSRPNRRLKCLGSTRRRRETTTSHYRRDPGEDQRGAVPEVHGEFEALQIAKAGGWEIEALILDMEEKDKAAGGKKGIFDLQFKDPRHFTWLLVAFASMGGLL